MRVLVMTAVTVEREAVERGLQGDSRFTVQLAGVGPIAAAAHTAAALATTEYDLVVSMGVAGGEGLVLIGKLLGHEHVVTTNRYAHLSDGPLQAAADRISSRVA